MLTPRPQTMDQMMAALQHVALYAAANLERRPYSDAVTRITCYAHTLPQLNEPDAFLTEAWLDGHPFTMLYTRTPINDHNLPSE